MVWSFTDPARMIALVSGLPLILFSIMPLTVRPIQSQHVFAALFVGTWGLQVVVTSLSQLTTDPALHDALYRSGLFLYLATPLFLIQFSATHPYRNGRTNRLPGLLFPLVLVSPGVLVLWFQPDLVFQTIIVAARPVPAFTAWMTPLVFAPFFVAFYYAAFQQFQLSRQSSSRVARSRARLVAMALVIFVAHDATTYFLAFADPGSHEDAQSAGVLAANVALFGTGLGLVVTTAMATAFSPGRRHDVDHAFIATIASVVLLAVAVHALSRTGVPVEVGWLMRIVVVGLLVYALARYRLFDIDVRHRRLLIATVPAGAFVLAALVVAALVSARGVDQVTLIVAALLLLAVIAVARRAPRIAERLLLVGDGEAAYVYHRKLEVYRAALEERSREGTLPPPEDDDLRRMRRRLGISESEHHALAFMVAKSRTTTGGLRADAPSGARVAPGQLVMDRYRIDRLLGSGQYGRVFLAHDENDARAVVVKVVATAAFGGHAAHLLAREARILASVDDPHIVQVEACHEGDDEVVLVLEHVAGGDLAGLLQRRGRLGVREAVALIQDILHGLAAAHRAGIVHRDLKPENVLLTADGTAKVADFGVARQAGPAATVAADGGPVGTLLYMSPEQVRGEPVDPRADLYAVGALMHRLVTGRHYLRVAGRDDFQIRRLILEAEPALDRAALPEPLCQWLTRALAKDPAARWTNADEMRRALAVFDQPTTGRPSRARSPLGAEP